jgi:hypothetical protein
MAFTLAEFARLRPYLYHLTAVANLDRIRRTGRLFSAASIFTAADQRSLVTARRRTSELITLDGERIHVRDQAPLHLGNMELEPGWILDDFVAHLNARVFFWPGKEDSPISYGVRHYERYRDEPPALLRLPTQSLFDENPNGQPLFCRYNSGSPRCAYGRKSPRTAKTFVLAAEAPFSAANVVEVTFENAVRLSRDCMHGDTPFGPWRPLFGV